MLPPGPPYTRFSPQPLTDHWRNCYPPPFYRHLSPSTPSMIDVLTGCFSNGWPWPYYSSSGLISSWRERNSWLNSQLNCVDFVWNCQFSGTDYWYWFADQIVWHCNVSPVSRLGPAGTGLILLGFSLICLATLVAARSGHLKIYKMIFLTK